MPLVTRYHLMLPLSLVLAVVADALFYHRPWGVNAAVFAAVLWFLLLARSPALLHTMPGRAGGRGRQQREAP